MSLTVQTPYVIYNGNGATTSFAIPTALYNNFDEDAEVVVYKYVTSTRTQTTLISATHYNITGSNVVTTVGNTIASGEKIGIFFGLKLEQETDMIASSVFNVETLEAQLDKIVMMTQQVKHMAARAIKFQEMDALTDYTLEYPEADAALIWNDDGTRIINGPSTTEISNAQTYAEEASDSADAAAASASAASTSASAASTSASAASTSATAAASSATAAASSASAAATSATNAATSASAAATSETNAASSASAASTSATAAASSATSASNSASTATTQASNASTSATNAATSETNAASSATNAATSETNAAASAALAATYVQTVFNSRGSPASITGGGSIAFTAGAMNFTKYVVGSGGAVSATLQAGTIVGQRARIVGTSDTNTVQIELTNGVCILGAQDSIDAEWDGTEWFETGRSV